MTQRKHFSHGLGFCLGVAATLAVACAGPTAPNEEAAGPVTFESDDPEATARDAATNGSGDGRADESGAGGSGAAGTGNTSAPGSSGDEAERAIVEADIVQVEGRRLYALSEHSGLTVIDVSAQDRLRVLGTYRTDATPFEMYVSKGRVYGLFSGWGEYVPISSSDTTAGVAWAWQQTSRVVALDATRPEAVSVLGDYEVPGDISDSRLVGEVLYVVAYENGYCWGCEEARPQTTVVSLDVSDPRTFAKVGELAFEDEKNEWGWGRRSITVTPKRMYVAGPEYSRDGNHGSSIQVVDISDPKGSMALGATVEAAGRVSSRWQMDESKGVLRVISQPPGWSSTAAPSVETWSIQDSNALAPLGELELVLPRRESLQSVRFDGDRAYAVTFERTDPLFTIDLSNPAAPKQVGELEMPGWLYHMEPRGERLVGLGFDDSAGGGNLHVSVFDVSDLAKPKMLDRVNFGGEWGWMAEDQDRIHKVLKLLPDEGLIMMPFFGWTRDNADGCRGGHYESGVQLIDWTTDSLELRGIAPSHGQAKRAFLHEGRLFAISDDRVETFDISNRDAPLPKATQALAHNVTSTAVASDKLVRLTRDWWTAETVLDVVGLDTPDVLEGKLQLNLSRSLETDRCGQYLYGLHLLGGDGNAHAVYQSWSYGGGPTTSSLNVLSFNVGDDAPSVVGRTSIPSTDQYQYYGAFGRNRVVASGDGMVQTRDALALLQLDAGYSQVDEPWADPTAWVTVTDLSDPATPVFRRVDLPTALGVTGLQVYGKMVVTSHFERTGNGHKVRFFLDRIDLTDPREPKLLPKLNIPGSLLALDSTRGRAITVGYDVRTSKTTDTECRRAHGYAARFMVDEQAETVNKPDAPSEGAGTPPSTDLPAWTEPTGTCEWLERKLQLVRLEGERVTLEGTHQLPDGTEVGTVAVGDGVVFASLGRNWWYAYEGWYGCDVGWYSGDVGEPLPLLVLGGLDDGKLTVAVAPVERSTPWYWGSAVNQLGAHGKKAVVSTGYNGDLFVIDATDPSRPVADKVRELQNGASDLSIVDGRAVFSLGYGGVEVIDLR